MTGRAAQGVSVINVAPGDEVAVARDDRDGRQRHERRPDGGGEPEPGAAAARRHRRRRRRPRRSGPSKKPVPIKGRRPSARMAAAPARCGEAPRRRSRAQAARSEEARTEASSAQARAEARGAQARCKGRVQTRRAQAHPEARPRADATWPAAARRPRCPTSSSRYLAGGRLVVAATVDAEGAPYTMVMNSALAIDPHTIRFALDHRTHSLVNSAPTRASCSRSSPTA